MLKNHLYLRNLVCKVATSPCQPRWPFHEWVGVRLGEGVVEFPLYPGRDSPVPHGLATPFLPLFPKNILVHVQQSVNPSIRLTVQDTLEMRYNVGYYSLNQRPLSMSPLKTYLQYFSVSVIETLRIFGLPSGPHVAQPHHIPPQPVQVFDPIIPVNQPFLQSMSRVETKKQSWIFLCLC